MLSGRDSSRVDANLLHGRYPYVEALLRVDWSPDQPRAENGEFGEGDGGASASLSSHREKTQQIKSVWGDAHKAGLDKSPAERAAIKREAQSRVNEIAKTLPTDLTDDEKALVYGNAESEVKIHELPSGELASNQDHVIDGGIFMDRGVDQDVSIAAHVDSAVHDPRGQLAARKEFTRALTDSQSRAAKFYTNGGDAVMNNSLRRGIEPSEKMSARYQKMDEMIARARTTEDVSVYRGVSGDFAETFASASVGDSFVDHGYVSTSTSEEVANNSRYASSTILHITVPAGESAAPIPSKYASEYEMLLPRSSQFTITKIEKTPTGRAVHVRMAGKKR